MLITLDEIKAAGERDINLTIQALLHEKCEHCGGAGIIDCTDEGSNQKHTCAFCMGHCGPNFAGNYEELQPLIAAEYPVRFQQCLFWILGTDNLHAWLTCTTLDKAKAWVFSQRAFIKPFKRNHWTNEEVTAILRGNKATTKEGQEPPQDIIYHNLVIDDTVSTFEDFMRPHEEAGAMAYDTETKFIVHIGQPLPR